MSYSETGHRVPDRSRSQDGCDATVRDHAWGHIKSDWFIQRNGDAFCAEHLPEWVPAWRARQAAKAEKKQSVSE